jgi:hypothetical protein
VEITSETKDSDENTEPFETNSEKPTNDASGDDVCQWFDEDDEASGSPVDILDIIQLQLKEVKKFHTTHAFKAFTDLTAVMQYVKLQDRYRCNAKRSRPCLTASLSIARHSGKGESNRSYFAQWIQVNENYLLKHSRLPPSKKDGLHGHLTLLDNKNVVHGVRKYLAAQSLGSISTKAFCEEVNKIIVPALGFTGQEATISEQTARNWLWKLGYSCVEVRKGYTMMAMSGQMLWRQERNSWMIWQNMRSEFKSVCATIFTKHNICRFMYTYDDVTMEPIPPQLAPGEKLHILLPQDECIVNVNEQQHTVWLLNGQQPLHKKGKGCAIMISDWICETFGRLRLSEVQIADQAKLPEAEWLRVTDVRRIIYPGKNHDKWWDLEQLKD